MLFATLVLAEWQDHTASTQYYSPTLETISYCKLFHSYLKAHNFSPLTHWKFIAGVQEMFLLVLRI